MTATREKRQAAPSSKTRAAAEAVATRTARRRREAEIDGPTSVRAILRLSAGGLLGQLAAMSLFINLLALAPPIFVLQVYDRVIPHDGVETLFGLVGAVLGVVAFDFVLKQARSRLVQMVATRVDIDLSRRLFARLTGLPLARLEATPDAEWRTMLRDVESVRDTVAGPTVVLLVDLPFAFLFIGVIALVATPVAGVLAALTALYAALAFLSAHMVARANRAEQDAALDQYGLVGEVVAGRSTVKALGLGDHLRERWESGQARMIRRAAARGRLVDSFSNLSGGLAMLTSVLMTTVGAVAIMRLDMTLGGLIAANMLSSRVVQPLTQLVGFWRGLERFRDAARRLDAALAQPGERREGVVERPRPKGALAAEKLCFSYAGDAAPTLQSVTAGFRPGAMTGIVGANGCGKTTLLKLLMGLYPPDSGRVLLDGVDIAQLGRRELSRWIGYAPQEPMLFSGAVRDAIAKGRADISDKAVLHAAQLAAADGFIAELPDGFGAEVGEGGRRFSPGQRQRLALARALVENPPVLLLDEPSANLDLQAESDLITRLDVLKRDRSIIVVSHSRPLLEACDTIMVMHAGRVAMTGRSADVLPRQLGAGARKAAERRPATPPASQQAPSQEPPSQASRSQEQPAREHAAQEQTAQEHAAQERRPGASKEASAV